MCRRTRQRWKEWQRREPVDCPAIARKWLEQGERGLALIPAKELLLPARAAGEAGFLRPNSTVADLLDGQTMAQLITCGQKGGHRPSVCQHGCGVAITSGVARRCDCSDSGKKPIVSPPASTIPTSFPQPFTYMFLIFRSEPGQTISDPCIKYIRRRFLELL